MHLKLLKVNTNINKAFFYVLKIGGTQSAENLMSYIFANQDSFTEEEWIDKTVNQFLDDLANKVSLVSVKKIFYK